MSRALAAVVAAGLLAAVGCGNKSGTPTSGVAQGHGHEHDRAGMKMEDAGPYHAGLTAHLSEKEGNELDMVFETQDEKDPKPVPLPLTEIVAKAKREGDPMEYELKFVPAEKDERKGDPEGKCSRFTAKAPWMKPDDKLTVSTTVEIEKKPRDLVWANFVPKKFAHQHD